MFRGRVVVVGRVRRRRLCEDAVGGSSEGWYGDVAMLAVCCNPAQPSVKPRPSDARPDFGTDSWLLHRPGCFWPFRDKCGVRVCNIDIGSVLGRRETTQPRQAECSTRVVTDQPQVCISVEIEGVNMPRSSRIENNSE